MRRCLALIAALAALAGCSKRPGGGAAPATQRDSIAYVIGMNVAENLYRMDSTMNAEALCAAILDRFYGRPRMQADEAEAYFLRYMNVTLPEQARAFEEQFLEDLAQSNRLYARTASGVTYAAEELGDQELLPASERDSVVVRWVIRTADGRTLDSSYTRGDTLRMAAGELKPGLRESLKMIGPGGRIDTWIPSKEAYGAAGDKTLGVGPNTTLHYEIELLDVVKYNRNRRN